MACWNAPPALAAMLTIGCGDAEVAVLVAAELDDLAGDAVALVGDAEGRGCVDLGSSKGGLTEIVKSRHSKNPTDDESLAQAAIG